MPKEDFLPLPAEPRVTPVPLTTKFSPPDSCETRWFFYLTADDPETTSIFRGWRELRGQTSLTSCFPTQVAQPKSQAVTFSPGICYQGHTTVFSVWRTESSDNFAICCPTSYELDIPEESATEKALSCSSKFFTPIVAQVTASKSTIPAVKSTDDLITIQSGVAWTDAIAVAYNPYEWDQFPARARPPPGRTTQTVRATGRPAFHELSSTALSVMVVVSLFVVLGMVVVGIKIFPVRAEMRAKKQKEYTPSWEGSFGKYELEGKGKDLEELDAKLVHELDGKEGFVSYAGGRVEVAGNPVIYEMDGSPKE